jgi:hypothetical protein
LIPQDKQQLRGLLQSGVSEVFFKKRNGSIRQMVCTLDPSQLPITEQARQVSSAFSPDAGEETPAQQNVLAVWDLEKMAWRSFRINSIVFYKKRGEQID